MGLWQRWKGFNASMQAFESVRLYFPVMKFNHSDQNKKYRYYCIQKYFTSVLHKPKFMENDIKKNPKGVC